MKPRISVSAQCCTLFESVNAKTLAVITKNFAIVTVGTASGEEPLSASTLPRCVQSTELNIRSKEKNFRKYQGSKNQVPFMPRMQASTIEFFNSSQRGGRNYWDKQTPPGPRSGCQCRSQKNSQAQSENHECPCLYHQYEPKHL